MSSPTDNSNQNQVVGPNYGRLRTYLSQSKTQTSNNPLFQTISQLITGSQSFQTFVGGNFNQIISTFGSITAAFQAINATLTALTNQVANQQDTIDNTILPALALLAQQVIYVVSVDTSVSPQTVNLSVVQGFTIIKDISGNASVNNITLTGTVEGVVNPLINTNYGAYHVYFDTNLTLFFKW